jgi:hypothetical protein
MKKLLVLIGASLLLSACGGAGLGTSAPKLDVKVGGKASTLNIKSAGVGYGNVISTSPGKPSVQTFAHTFYLANYELDTTNVGTMRKTLTAPDQMRVGFELTGEEGTKDDSPLKVGTYGAKADKINSVRWISIVTFADGKETTTDFDTMGLTKKADGDVKITAITTDSVSGEINVTEGDKSVKGTFTAKLPKKK